MPTPTASTPLAALYERDETAWLDATAALIRQGRLDELDLPNLAEFLESMAGRDRREVKARLAVLMAHLLKWRFQPAFRSRSWRTTIDLQRSELADLLERGVLRNHATEVLADAYSRAVLRASAETGLPPSSFPADCPFSLDDLLTLPDDRDTLP